MSIDDPIAATIHRYLQPGTLAFDIGANRGHYTRLMTATGARVVAFEPNPDVQADLAADLPAAAEVVRMAVSDRAGTASFFLDKRAEQHGMASSLLRLPGLDGTMEIAVPTVTIDDFCAARTLRPKFIKIDAEGAEPMILAGGRKTVRRDRPVLVFEMWEARWPHYLETIEWLASSYDMVRLADGAPVPGAYLDGPHSGVADILAVPKRSSFRSWL